MKRGTSIACKLFAVLIWIAGGITAHSMSQQGKLLGDLSYVLIFYILFFSFISGLLIYALGEIVWTLNKTAYYSQMSALSKAVIECPRCHEGFDNEKSQCPFCDTVNPNGGYMID